MSFSISFFSVLLLFSLTLSQNLPLNTLTLPPGFNIEIYANRSSLLGNSPREMNVQIYNGATIIYVATVQNRPNNVIAIIDRNQDNIIDDVFIIYQGSNTFSIDALTINPKTGQLFLSQPDTTYYCDGNTNDLVLNHFNENSRITCHPWFECPYSSTEHSLHFMRINPGSNEVCMAFGQECNECINQTVTPPKSSIKCYNEDPSKTTSINDGTIMATGIRNSYGFDFHPITNQLWFTDNGRDNLYSTTNMPDDELNIVSYNGEFFGYPYCHSLGCGDPYVRDINCVSAITDPSLGDGGFTDNCTTNITLAHQPMSPHVATLGMKFYTYNMFPSNYKNAIFVAEHGSWDRTPLIGYRVGVVFVSSDDNRSVIKNDIFIQGWLNDTTQNVWGRVNSLEYLPDGSMIIADDQANVIYRVYYNANEDNELKQIQYQNKKKELQELWDRLDKNAGNQ